MTADTIGTDDQLLPPTSRTAEAVRATQPCTHPPDVACAVLAFRGDLDLASSPELLHDVEALLAEGVLEVELDLEQSLFCDVAGLAALIDARDLAQSTGGGLTVRHPCWSLELLMELFELTSRLGPVPTPSDPGHAEG